MENKPIPSNDKKKPIIFLETSRLVFSKWSEDDLTNAMVLWGDSEVTKFISASGKFTKEDVENRLKNEIKQQEKYQVQYWPIFEKNSDEFVGVCGLRMHDAINNVYELGFHLKKDYWGQGYALEAARSVINYAFSDLDATELFAGHHPDNYSSQKLLRKLGFCYTGKEFYQPTKLFHPSYRLTKTIDRGEMFQIFSR
ncbi:GNAT family N-acetyltransferase [Vagococcus sp. BWB3-3]|uniref:GNAT family N-acetyltransferase n=1 Tax=Vagococcus allomyrinae TaxID=2794353 RepID=A0A940SVC5_9ENTE|nr:GNAT family N-acetyltransferase [Vagococcus allomyrinae]MBP1040198.1 GNAT family N-acetyltransferase [Vagococcus allomyrinae]